MNVNLRNFLHYRFNALIPFQKAVFDYSKYIIKKDVEREYRVFFSVQLKYLFYCLIGIFQKQREKSGEEYESCKRLFFKKQFSNLKQNKKNKNIEIGPLKFQIPNNFEEFLNLIHCYEDIFIQDRYSMQHTNLKGDIIFPSFYYNGGEGPYEIKEVQIKEGDIVIDAGANIGLFSILSAKKGAKKVYAFEPSEYTQTYLNKNILNNDLNNLIYPVKYGLFSKKCSLEFVQTEGNIGSSGCVITNNSKEGMKYNILVISLDEWVIENNIPRIDFIKADIEGAERYLLEGAKETIRRFHPKLSLCTYHLPDDRELLPKMILNIDDTYKIHQERMKLYAW